MATVTPTSDAACANSPGHLGTTNLAATSDGSETTADTTVVNIYALKVNPTTTTAYGWVYVTGDNNLFIQYNPAVGGSGFLSFLGTAMSGIPFAGPGANSIVQSLINVSDNPVSLSEQQWNAIQQGMQKNNTSKGDKGDTVAACFTGPLPLV